MNVALKDPECAGDVARRAAVDEQIVVFRLLDLEQVINVEAAMEIGSLE